MLTCKHCNHKLVLASASISSLEPSNEPYQHGVKETVDFDITVDVSLSAMWCPAHGIQSIWITDPEL